jgi:hypothetical protein
MYLRAACLPLLLVSVFFQVQGDLFRRHYEAANAYHRAGNFAGAEAEFKVILGEAYHRLAKIYSAQGNSSQRPRFVPLPSTVLSNSPSRNSARGNIKKLPTFCNALSPRTRVTRPRITCSASRTS